MPTDQREADQVLEIYNQRNGRYYIKADVALADGVVTEVVFDGDTVSRFHCRA